MARLPPLQAGERVRLVLRLRDGDQGLSRAAAAFRRKPGSVPGFFLLPGGGDPRRLPALLPVVRRPWRVGEARGLLRGREREQSVERSRRLVDSGGSVAALRK